jgi:Flavodoxin
MGSKDELAVVHVRTNAPSHTATDGSKWSWRCGMKVMIVYESMFGNTHHVAQAIGDGLREAQPDAEVQCIPVGEASAEVSSVDLLVVGGPTHIRGMTTGFSRKMGISGEEKAEAKGEPAHELGCAKEAAAFDTRLNSRMAGGASHGIARRLFRHGYYLVSDPEGFVVEDAYGPLHAGEIERAKQWGAQLVKASASRPHSS